MKMKGTAFLARKKVVTEKFGQPAWDEFIAETAEEVPFLSSPVMATTAIPIEDFIRFQEALVRRFYNGNPKAYWDFGAASAQWSLTEGPYRAALAKSDLKALVLTFPGLWSNYYDDGQMVATLSGPIVHVRIVNLPMWHIAFEMMVMGYFARALEMYLGHKVASKRLIGGSPGPELHYVFYV